MIKHQNCTQRAVLTTPVSTLLVIPLLRTYRMCGKCYQRVMFYFKLTFVPLARLHADKITSNSEYFLLSWVVGTKSKSSRLKLIESFWRISKLTQRYPDQFKGYHLNIILARSGVIHKKKLLVYFGDLCNCIFFGPISVSFRSDSDL